MLNIAHSLNHQIHEFPSRDTVIQEANALVLWSLLPFVITFAGAILLGRAGLGTRADLSDSRTGLEKLTVGLFIVWVVSLLIRALLYAPSGWFGTLLSILGLAGYEVAVATLIIGGISLRSTTGSRGQRTWQYLARGAFIVTCLFLVAALVFFVILIMFVATFHLFD
jgi:hypothetical protein